VLRQVASRLLHSLPPGDEVARIGDDSFAVLTYAGSAGDAGRTPLTCRPAGCRWLRRHLRLGRVPTGRLERAVALPGRRRATVRATHHPPSDDGGRAETLGDLSVIRRRGARARTSLRRRAPRDRPRRRRVDWRRCVLAQRSITPS
jgi:GGDEF domain-containing protein